MCEQTNVYYRTRRFVNHYLFVNRSQAKGNDVRPTNYSVKKITYYYYFQIRMQGNRMTFCVLL